MAMKTEQRGFALLIAVIFMSAMLTFGLALGSLGYKQQVLASSAIQSQYAFYAADSALECALYADQQLNLFAHVPPAPPGSPPVPAPRMTCDNSEPISAIVLSHTETEWAIELRLSLDSGTRCADVTIYKPAPESGMTYIFSRGYDVSCAALGGSAPNFVSRGLETSY